jgi:hypothetical protein
VLAAEDRNAEDHYAMFAYANPMIPANAAIFTGWFTAHTAHFHVFVSLVVHAG